MIRSLPSLIAFLPLLAQSTPLGETPPGRVPVRFAADVVRADHSSPTLSPDGREIYWAQRRGEEGPRRILFATLSEETWSEPAVTAFTAVEDGDCPVVSPDGGTLYFNSSRPLPGQEGGRRERIWFVTREADGWSDPAPVSEAVNGAHLHWQTSVDRAGNLYFGSERRGSLGRDDIFAAPWSEGAHGEAQSLPAPINTESHESMPFVDPDGDYLLFVRAHYGAGEPPHATGLLASFREEDGTWTEPVRVPLEGEAGRNAACPFVSRDGRFLFFLVMTRSEKSVWWVDAAVIGEADPRRP